MRQKNKGEGTKIAQAAKDLNVTSVTIRRYISEFNIDTMSDENGIKVLPPEAMEELFEIRKLKDDGHTNPQVMEALEARRAAAPKERKLSATKEVKEKAEPVKKAARSTTIESTVRSSRSRAKKVAESEADTDEEAADKGDIDFEPPIRDDGDRNEADDEVSSKDGESEGDSDGMAGGEGRSKHNLTCQTCNKVFEHMNPKLRDCLDCYRAKRKERRKGGDKHKNVIQHPIAQQVLNKAQQNQQPAVQLPTAIIPGLVSEPVSPSRAPVAVSPTPLPAASQRTQVRNYRKAIEETRHLTSNLKRRLERPDLPEADRRFLEQIYAYQLILHQGWKHLSEYKSNGDGSSRPDRGDRGDRPERPERGDRGERADRPERAERPERIDRLDRPDRPSRQDPEE